MVFGMGITGEETHQAASTITVKNTVVDPGGSLMLRANESITLKPGFHAGAGSSVQATIGSASGDGISSLAGTNPWQVEVFSYDSEGRMAE
jgi:hypothetical protein